MTAHEVPSVTVVVPAFRRADRLVTCLEALAAQDHPRDRLEVVVVDDGSPQPLAPAAERFAGRLDVRVHRQSNAGPAVARNAGVRRARGDLLAFTDDDCAPAPGWVAALARAHRAQPGALLGGAVVNALPGNRYAEASQILLAFLYEWFADGSSGRFFASNNMAAPRRDFLELGGFDEGFPRPGGEDRELSERWARSGRALAEVPGAVVAHAHHMGLRGYLRQHVNYGAGAYHVHRRRAAHGGGLTVLPPAFYRRLLGRPFRTATPRRAVPLAALLAVSQAANAAGFLLERRRARGDRPAS